MKYQLSIHYFLLGFIAIVLSSCNPDPVDYLDEDEMFSSVDRLDQAVLGVYEAWYPEHTIRISSLITDECSIGSQNTGVDAQGQSIFRWTFSSDDDDVLAPWKNGYQVIARANKILNGIDDVPVKNDSEKQKRTSLKGELLAIRAYVHFDLYRVYGNTAIYNPEALAVPYMKESKTSSQPSRPTTEAFFIDLWNDITTAEASSPSDSDIRMGITALESLHARVALYTQKYDEAADYASRVIDKRTLSSIYDYPQIWTDTSVGEVIFKLKRTNISSIRPGDLFFNINSDRLLFTASQELEDMYDQDNDVRFDTWFGSDEIETDDPNSVISKYEGSNDIQNLNDVKVFRVSEMYLIRAEALLSEKGFNSQSVNDLNALRNNRIEDYVPETFSNNAQKLFAAILDERYKEFPYEGQRYFDFKRLGMAINRNGGEETLDATSKHYYIPIPQSEVLANPNIRPNNTGW